MPFEIVRNDLTNMQVDVIVNAANSQPVIGYGVDSGVHKKAGSRLLAARKKIGRIIHGDVRITPAFDLDAKYVIHAVSPVWHGGTKGESILLENCYTKSLELARKHGCQSIAFPLLASGNHGFPKDLALQIAVGAIGRFLMLHDMQVYLVIFSREAVTLSETLFHSVKSYIDDHYILEKTLEEFGLPPALEDSEEEARLLSQAMQNRRRMACRSIRIPDRNCVPKTAPPPCTAPRVLEELMQEAHETFSEGLIRLIDQKGFKDPQVYKKANIDRKLFSKIKNNKDYKPGKNTCIAFAIALELNLDETRDLLGKAGYALTHSSKFDIIIEYFILNKNYNVFEINEVLFAFDQPLIGA